MQNSERHYPDRREAHSADDNEETDNYGDAIPAGDGLKALLIGLIAGIVGALVSVVISFLGSPVYQQAAREAKNLSLNLAYAELGLACLSFLISLLVCFFAGFSAGKRVVLRKFGFYAGALAIIVIFLCQFVARYIPNYPGNLASQGSSNAAAFSGGLIASLIILLIWAFIGGLMGLWGAARATRNHPYYLREEEEEAR
jgi:amino acid transporter